LSLERLARKNGIESHVIFFNQFVELEELTKFIGAADLYYPLSPTGADY
jgi:hypothetical protein